MISSVFGKTKPVNYIILLAFLFLFYWYVQLIVFQLDYSSSAIFQQILVVGVLLFMIFLVNFIVRRNQINEANSYAILFFTLLFVVFPEVFRDNNAILCCFFVLLATRRLISLRTLKKVPQKIFDATIWVLIASLFYDWALLFLIVVYTALYFYQPKGIKNWLIPLVAFLTIGMITGSWLILTNRVEFLEEHYVFSISSEINQTTYWLSQMKLNIYLALVILANMFAFINLTRFGHGRIISVRLITLILGIAIFITLIKTTEGDYPVVLTFFPTAVIFARYTEISKRPKVKEIALLLLTLLPFVIFVLEWVVK